MSTTAMKFVNLVEDGVAKEHATVNTGRYNTIVVSGISNNGTLKFDVSVDDGVTWVEDASLEFTEDGVIVLQRSAAIIKPKLDAVSDASGLVVQLGF